MDQSISRWILIFLAQQRGINCSVLKPLLSVLPLPEDDFLLKKLHLLCRIRFQIDEDSSITEEMLHCLEVLEELDSHMGVASITASLVKAYRAVAVECTARYLPGKVDRKSQYFGALERIWRGRIRLMEQAESGKRSGLLTDELLLWSSRLEAALTDPSVRGELVQINVRTEAFRLLKAYLDEELENLLPLLAVPAKDLAVRGNKGVDLNISPNHSSPPRENLKRHAPFKATRVLRPRRNRGVRIADEDELETGTSACTATVIGKKETLQATRLVKNLFPDAKGVAELPKSGPQKVTGLPREKHKKSSNLEQDVNVAEEQIAPQSGYMAKDPLPAANQVTDRHPSDQHEGVSDHGKDVNAAEEPGLQSRYLAKNPLPDAHTETEMPASDQYNKISNLGKDVSAAEKSLKEINAASSVPEKSKNQACGGRKLPNWEERAGLVGQDKANPSTRPQDKSNPDAKPVIVPTRRTSRRWSSEEEDTLRAGVQKFGEGQWKRILDCYSNIFEGRTSMDLKDKWRNLLRYPLPKI